MIIRFYTQLATNPQYKTYPIVHLFDSLLLNDLFSHPSPKHSEQASEDSFPPNLHRSNIDCWTADWSLEWSYSSTLVQHRTKKVKTFHPKTSSPEFLQKTDQSTEKTELRFEMTSCESLTIFTLQHR